MLMPQPAPTPHAVPPIAPNDALFLDFDGTLAPIQDSAADVQMDPVVCAALVGLSKALEQAVAIISGRDIRDLSLRTPDALWRIGGHGLDVCRPGEAPPTSRDCAPADLAEALCDIAQTAPGSFVEDKGPILAMHYRAAPDAGPKLLDAVTEAAGLHADYLVQHGKMVIEVKPKHANKGAAVRRMMATPPFAGRRVIMVGDDVTDEDAFRAVHDLDGLAIKVGEGATVADLRMPDPASVHDWLLMGGRVEQS